MQQLGFRCRRWVGWSACGVNGGETGGSDVDVIDVQTENWKRSCWPSEGMERRHLLAQTGLRRKGVNKCEKS